ncbi:MAG: hypothetical protein K9N09_00540 [Candidatus Cloacimonetes bacterium]|nr:hypothetical protein [Candidatus Cloacimonadota bacterium]MCF7812950.1 hypothetical protein [Candidatus Cloacimonadota bacterium]MCF7867161.1 hypothetical protein [Candidatus Cloacimonadota bacterium]MCF7882519.1 hypothetical protein [Candidatus Cloacimonadota bacterium]
MGTQFHNETLFRDSLQNIVILLALWNAALLLAFPIPPGGPSRLVMP